jgi:hypothetical protein
VLNFDNLIFCETYFDFERSLFRNFSFFQMIITKISPLVFLFGFNFAAEHKVQIRGKPPVNVRHQGEIPNLIGGGGGGRKK